MACKNKKNNFVNSKEKAIKSLKDVNCFLSNINLTLKSIKIYKWFK